MWDEKTVTEDYEDKDDSSSFLKDSNGEGLNLVAIVQEESFLYCEYRRLSTAWAWQMEKLHVVQREKEP